MAYDALWARKAGVLATVAAAGLMTTGTALAPIPAAARPHTAAVVTVPGAPALPDASLTAQSWAVMDVETGRTMAGRDMHRRLAPASTLKTLFAVTVLPKFPQTTVHRVAAADLAGIGAGSSVVGVQEGKQYKVADLWRGVFLRSGNDAVRVLASMNGGWAATAKEMQAKARALGAGDTQVKSPDGYDTPGQVSSAYDLNLFGRAGLANADFARYCGTASAQFPGDGGSTTEIQNTNRMLSGTDGVPRYPGIIGVKNGYTTNAGNTLVAAARRNGHTILVTVMNPRSGVPNAVYSEARSLLDWGFSAVGSPQSGQAGAPAGRGFHAGPGGDGAAGLPPVTAEVGESAPLSGGALWAGGGAVLFTAGTTLAWRRRSRARPRGRGAGSGAGSGAGAGVVRGPGGPR
ncbi:D-alanyl-D-alanine carboxypeptidase [Streptomyces sp. MST-110588]|uniref:D-alanyl-D-alanine carboxypeptidase family protein n=1 Tax=Streptomyces sp. MST-110588 TaxID=2833628 RepID=UPI001F5C96C6|nr:D-alanyl-D-alanine carboxypeptidase [Streptomyces sp. MST-110588]UNO43136.1 D-alanyl-D-alanine carboxypeptidase [Streptomyces sp. MST-110588]